MVFENLLLILFLLLIVVIILYYFNRRKLKKLEEKYQQLGYDYKSMYVKHGNQFESFVPFMDNYPGEKENTVFIGKPIDFISFDDDSIKFIEVKTGKSSLNENQKRVKRLIKDKKVAWYELKYDK